METAKQYLTKNDFQDAFNNTIDVEIKTALRNLLDSWDEPQQTHLEPGMLDTFQSQDQKDNTETDDRRLIRLLDDARRGRIFDKSWGASDEEQRDVEILEEAGYSLTLIPDTKYMFRLNEN